MVADIDTYDHVNNSVYMIWFDRAALVGERLSVATWVLPSAGKSRIMRRFQAWRGGEGITLARADIEYACIERYRVLDDVVAAARTVAPI